MTFQTLHKLVQRNVFQLWQREIPCLHFLFTPHCKCAENKKKKKPCYHKATPDCRMNNHAKLQFKLPTTKIISDWLGQEQ